MLTSLYGKLCEFCGEKEQFDDVTMLLIEVAKEDVITLSPPTYDDIPKITDRINSQLCGDGEKIAELDKLAEENGSDYQKLMEIQAEKDELDTALMELYERWEALNG